tara:strand:+ start:179106 stop:179693 length:588 start_codon:yes stop_codon:yes gene_type:complete
VVILVPAALVAVPILTHSSQGLANQDPAEEEWPTRVTASGDDGRDRALAVSAFESSEAVDTSSLAPGDQLVVTGSGYDPARGIYVAVCRIPDNAGEKPGPCLGGVPAQEQQDVAEGTIQFAASNWVNDDWAWRLFGARSFDDPELGDFTAYIEVPEPVDEGLDCRVEACAIYTRNDHTAAADRVQDLAIPVGFAD